MTPEQLLIPRFKCIAPLPFQPDKDMYKVGDIFTDDGKTVAKNQNGDPVYPVVWQEYPHLFKPLEWHEDRAQEDLPEYLIYQKDFHYSQGTVVQAKKYEWEWRGKCWWFNDGRQASVSLALRCVKDYLPATHEEYESYLKEKDTNQLNNGQD